MHTTMCQQTDCVTTVRSSSYCSGVPFKLLLLFKKQQRILLQRTNQPTEYCLFACEAKTHQRNYCYYHRHHIELCVYLCIKYENPVCERAEGIRKYRANDVLRIRKLSVAVAVRSCFPMSLPLWIEQCDDRLSVENHRHVPRSTVSLW